MHKILLITAFVTSFLFAGGDVAPVVVEEPVIEETSNWAFELSPYFAMSSISGTSAIGRAGVSDIDVDFGQISDALEFGAAAHFEALHNSGWGLWIDYNYVSLGGSQKGPLGLTTIKVDIEQIIFEGFAMYRQPLENGTLDYLAGIRRWKMNISTEVFRNREWVDEQWTDFIIGTRWTTNLSENWKFMLRGDIGAGESDFTATVAAGFRYSINEWLDFDLQYKALWVDYETGSTGNPGHFIYDTTTYGPVLGLNFKF